MVDPNSLNNPNNLPNGELMTELKQKSLVNQTGNSQNGPIGFLPSLVPDLTNPPSQQMPISAGGSGTFRIPDSLLSTSQMNLNGMPPVPTTGNTAPLPPPSLLNSLNSSSS